MNRKNIDMAKIYLLSVVLTGLLAVNAVSMAAVTDKYTIHVPGDCKTIKEACEKSLPGDTILLGEGEFTADSSIVFKGNTRLAGHGADKTIVKLGREGLSIVSVNGSINNLTLEALTIEVYGFPLSVSGMNGLKLKKCILRGKNLSTCLKISSVENAVISNCDIVNGGYGLQLWQGPKDLTIRNSIFYNNRVGIFVTKPPIMANPNDISKKDATKYWQKPREDVYLKLEYNIFWNVKDFIDYRKGDRDLMSDPKFMNPAKDDYSLKTGSPCIDSGDPDTKYNDTDGSRCDIGAIAAGKKK